tara:strand:- start:290 stop:1780 length:1491 start_codon:yes stop_codon:yes gene_type:complete
MTLMLKKEKKKEEQVTDFTKPLSIKEEVFVGDFSDNESYNACNYSLETVKDYPSPIDGKIIPKGKMYSGAHGSDKSQTEKNCNIQDGYKDSSKNAEFRALYSGNEPIFKKTYWNPCDTWSEAQKEEHRFLNEFDNNLGAKKSKMSWNDNNGFPVTWMVNRKAVQKMVKEILKRENNKWGVVYQTKDEFKKDLKKRQVRETVDSQHQNVIQYKIDDFGGNVRLEENPNVNPIVIFKNRESDGSDRIEDGNGTSGAILKSNFAQEVPIIPIPLEDHEHLSDTDTRHMSNCLNKVDAQVKDEVKVEDAIKFLLDTVPVGKKYDTKEYRTMLVQDYGLSYPQVNIVMKGVKDELYKNEVRKKNQTIPVYDTEELLEFEDKQRKAYPNALVFYMAITIGDKIAGQILKKLDEEIRQAIKDKRKAKGQPIVILDKDGNEIIQKGEVVVCNHYSRSKTVHDDWNDSVNGGKITFERQWKQIMSNVEVTFVPLPLTKSDTTTVK